MINSAHHQPNPPLPEPVTHRARWVMIGSGHVVEDGYVTVANGTIQDVGRGNGPSGGADTVHHGDGVIMPPLVNAHAHLELSALRGRVPWDQGFKAWVRRLLAVRENLAPIDLDTGVADGIQEMLTSGTAVVGEVSTLGITRNPFWSSLLNGVWFREVLGSETVPLEDIRITKTRKESLAGHAVHTTDPAVLKHSKGIAAAGVAPFSMHLAESEDESVFIETGKGAWADFLIDRGIEFSHWPLRGRSPVQYADDLGLLDRLTLAVHLLRIDGDDLKTLTDRGVHGCCCPRSNLNLHGRLPMIEAMVRCGMNVCLGTDSLASVASLNLLEEMRLVAATCESLRPQEVIDMGTRNGAVALGVDNAFGTLEPGKTAILLFLPITAVTIAQLRERIINGELGGEAELFF